ncbi:MAG: hypothetical protein U1E65_33390 [Myxococcota bacterium]
MALDINALAKDTWKLFEAKPLDHILAGFAVGVLSVITLGVLSGPLYVGYIQMCEKQRRGEPIQFGDIFKGLERFGTSFVLMILLGLGVTLGFMLLVLPGLVLAAGWFFAFNFAALRNTSAVGSLGASWRLFRANTGPVLTVLLIDVLVGAVGGAVFPVTLVTTPLTVIFTTLVFAQLAPGEA